MLPLPQNSADLRDLLEQAYGHPEKDAMTPYERVEAALRRLPSDRVPFDFWAVPETIQKLKQFLMVDQEEDLLRLLGVDCRTLSPVYVGPKLETLPDGSYFSPLGSHRRRVANEFSTYEEYAGFPLAAARTRAEVETWERWPRPEYFDWEPLKGQIAAINQPVPHHIRVDIGGIFEEAWSLYGLDHFLTSLIENPEAPNAIMACYTDLMIANVHNMMAAIGDQIDLVYTFDDVAVQNGLLMSPKMWRQFILPHHQRLNEVIKGYGLKILYHSCGAIYPLIGALIDDMHIDVLNPLQPRARWMDMETIKREFGGRIAFHGGIDLQQTLPYGTQEDVVNEVQSRCRVLGKGGGYICTSAHYIQADVPLENIFAMYLAPRS